MAGTEFVGMVLMVLVLEKSFHVFRVKMLAPDALRLSAATGAIVAFVALAVCACPNVGFGDRTLAIIKVGVVCLAALIAIYPALYLTGSISGAELRSIRNVFRRSEGAVLPSVE